MGAFLGGDEELGAVGVGARIRRAQQARFRVLDLEILVLELGAVNGLATWMGEWVRGWVDGMDREEGGGWNGVLFAVGCVCV